MKNRILKLIILILIIISFLRIYSFAITIPEKDINLKIENLTKGCTVYLLLPENLLKYNMERFISNNKDNPYAVEAEEADKLEKYLNNSDYLGYIDYFKELGYPINYNEIILRHYCFCLGDRQVLGSEEYNGQNYIKIKINLNDQNEFKLIMKDYLVSYDARDIKFLIDEYGTYTYIDLSDKEFSANPEESSIIECNINYEFYSTEDFGEIQRAIDLAYIILIIIFITSVVIVFFALRKKHKQKKEEKAARRFWEKRLTKEEKKQRNKNLKRKRNYQKRKEKIKQFRYSKLFFNFKDFLIISILFLNNSLL